MPTFLFGILLFDVPSVLGMDIYSGSLRLSLLVLIFIGTFAVPSLLLYYLLRIGYIQSLQLHSLAERRLPYLLTGLVYLFVAYLFAFRMELISTIAPEIGLLVGSSAVAILLVGLISLSWQISAHGVGLGGLIGLLGGFMYRFSLTDLFLPFIFLVLLTGFVASARLKLNAHTPAQINAGIGLGLVISLLTVFWFV